MVAILLVCLSFNPAIASETGPDDWARVQVDSVRVLLTKREFDAAVDLSRTLVDSLESRDAQGAELALGLECLARSLRRNRKYREPETLILAQRAVTACDTVPPAAASLKAACLNTLGLVHYQRADYDDALPLFVQATELWRATYGDFDQRVAAGLNNQGLVLQRTSRNDEARLVLEQVLPIYAARQDEEQYYFKLAGTNLTLAKLHYKLGQYDLALDLAAQSVQMYRTPADGAHPRLGAALGDLAAINRARGNLKLAATLYAEAIPVLEAAHGPQYSEVGRILNNLGNLQAEQGDIAAARSSIERALTITENSAGPDSPQTGYRLLNLSSILAQLGDLELATAYLMRAEDIFQTRLGPDHFYMGHARQELGLVLAAKGELEAGLTRLVSALAIFEAELGPDHLTVATVLRDTGELLTDLHRFDEAQQNFRRGLAIVRAELGAEHPEVARILHGQGQLALRENQDEHAAAVLASALAVGTTALGTGHPDLAGIHLDLATALANLQQPASAFEHALAAERIGRNHFALAAVAFEERRVLQYALKRPNGLGLAAALALELNDPQATKRLWDELVRSRGLVLDLMGTRQRHQQSTPESADLRASLAEATRELAHLFVRGVGEDSPAEHRNALATARSRREELELQLARTSLSHARQMAVGRGGYQEVVASLPADAVLVSYLTATRDQTDNRMAALILEPGDSEPRLVALGSARVIDGAIIEWRRTFIAATMTQSEQLSRVADNCQQAGRRLAALVWDPLNLDQNRGTIGIVPEGLLTHVDFLALPRKSGGFLVENQATLTVVSAERDLLTRAESAATTSGLLVMGGMDFGSPVKAPGPRQAVYDCADYQALSFTPLPGTLLEAETVANLWSVSEDEPVRRLVGSQASEGAFKKMAADYRIAHLATHGFFLGGECRDPARVTRGVGVLQPDPQPVAVDDLTHPLLRAGLAFSGANQKKDQDEDGILTAYEVAGLDLSGVEVAVLSACDTGQGELLDGEGLLGLQRSFALAGAQGLVMSLWPVDDEIAAAWMEKFYRSLLEGQLDYQRAASQASREMLLECRTQGLPEHPFLWSPFVAVRTGS